MNRRRFVALLNSTAGALVSLTNTKGEEYKGEEDNQFGNFERIARDLGLTREQVLQVYLTKHLDSIKTFIRDGAKGRTRAYSEPIESRIDDAILYLMLLKGMVVEGRTGAPATDDGERQHPPEGS